MAERVRVFVSHHHSLQEDRFTTRLVADLEAAGADVWVDYAGINSNDFVRQISDGLADRHWLVLVMTPAALASRFVQLEVNTALAEHIADRMQGVLLLEMITCEVGDIPLLWRTLHRIDASQGYEPARERLLDAIGLATSSDRSGIAGQITEYSLPSYYSYDDGYGDYYDNDEDWDGYDHDEGGDADGDVSDDNGGDVGYDEGYRTPKYSLERSEPRGIAVGHDGALWFTEHRGNRIGRITPSGEIAEFAVPSHSEPYGIAPGPDGALWFTAHVTSFVDDMPVLSSWAMSH